MNQDMLKLLSEDVFKHKKSNLKHQFQLYVFKHSMKFRFFLESCFTLFLTLFF